MERMLVIVAYDKCSPRAMLVWWLKPESQA